MQILAATDFSTRSNRALRQAGLLASPVNAQLHVVHVVDDDQPDDLIRIEKKEAGRILEEHTASMPELKGVDVRLMVVTGDPFAGILKTAEDVKTDLIVLGSHRKQILLDIFVGTTIERVVRKGSFPVLMVNHEAQRKYEKIVVPVDMSDPSAHAIHVALSKGLMTDKGATLVHAFTALAAGKMSLVGTDQASIDSYIASERQRVTDELVAFLVSNDLGDRGRWKLRVEEGGAMEIISRAVAQLGADLLVMGTHGRSGLLKALIGSVTEEALRSLNVDILAVPPARR
jgi:nucleotide-binding universal stress UspA family protein